MGTKIHTPPFGGGGRDFFLIPVPWIKCQSCALWSENQCFGYVLRSVTSWFKRFVQDNSGPCQIHVTYFIFQINCRLSLMSCSSKCSDMQKLVPVNSLPCHSMISFCYDEYIDCCKIQPSTKKKKVTLGLRNLDGSCNKYCHEKLL